MPKHSKNKKSQPVARDWPAIVWPEVDQQALIQHRRGLQDIMGAASYPEVEEWLLGRVLDVYWEGQHPQAERPEDPQEVLGTMKALQFGVCSANNSRCLTINDLLARRLAQNTSNGQFCGHPLCPGCSAYRFYQLLRTVACSPPGYLIDRLLGYHPVTTPYPEEAQKAWHVREPSVRALGWQNLADYTAAGRRDLELVQGRRGFWWSPTDCSKRGLKIPGWAAPKLWMLDTDRELRLTAHQEPNLTPQDTLVVIDDLTDPQRGWYHPAGAVARRDESQITYDTYLGSVRATNLQGQKQSCSII